MIRPNLESRNELVSMRGGADASQAETHILATCSTRCLDGVDEVRRSQFTEGAWQWDDFGGTISILIPAPLAMMESSPSVSVLEMRLSPMSNSLVKKAKGEALSVLC